MFVVDAVPLMMTVDADVAVVVAAAALDVFVCVASFVFIAIYVPIDHLVAVNWTNAGVPIRPAAESDRTVCADADSRSLFFHAAIHLTTDRADPVAPCNFSCRKCNR